MIPAGGAGTYTAIVASSDGTYSETGNYLLTLAKSGPFVVPTNDEGGPMTNAVSYRATISRADLDQWVFNATAGQALSIGVTKVSGDAGFNPWIRV